MSQAERCPHCGRAMERDPRVTVGRTRDHIFPREWGGTDVPINIKMICKQCNEHRAMAGHCVGALACARACVPHFKQVPLLLHYWRLPKPISPMQAYLEWDAEMRQTALVMAQRDDPRPVRLGIYDKECTPHDRRGFEEPREGDRRCRAGMERGARRADGRNSGKLRRAIQGVASRVG